ncbi:TetR/AcrR family transcriptional regulator [Rhodococcus sp. NPDC003318]|uniref:TetR/AcrR family transcriptional regulator n=1 Tax=Rhodococcus sp. NPDC003318 TaxID=3364503 RepID=UPI00368AA37C
MPKVLDHDQRRQEIAEAVWRLIMRDGMSGVSVRDVAAEANLSTGSLRHMFATKTDLLAYSMQLVHARLGIRVRAHVAIADPRERALAMLSEVLPLDEVRRTQLIVILSLTTEAPSHPAVQELTRQAQRETRQAYVGLLEYLSRKGLVAPHLDIELEAVRLHALVDGAALHSLLGEPDTPDSALKVVTDHLDSLAP